MRAGRLGIERPALRASNAVILFWVGPYRMGIDAGALKEIRNDQNLAPEEFGCEAILSAHALLGVPTGQEGRLLVLRPGRVAVRVDRVERMIETTALRPLPQAFQGAERSWYSGLVLVGETVCPMMNPETLKREAKPNGPEALAPRCVPPVSPQEAASL
jgi:hypothetical protein